ncbi:hypothetical protein [Rheinheimera sp. MMS21-TC3]|uniref:hypothetical protein n=1 Tax=Rheinheimera sp. MMS21-TC3 TaxID=3072790 RepID=UPI0028C3BD3C|nr:hypothetical protein [Rheinheimera sp. MMS21-TC3]WNO59719.1 hypothetical protein RDV63_01815 [Rheinheimera sp. MMS21-TC3]
MDVVKECKELCKDKEFLRVLDLARGQVGDEVRSANSGAGYDPMRVRRSLGVIIRKNSKGIYSFSRVSSNVPQGRECVGNNGLTCNFIDIIDDKFTVAILVGVSPGTRLESFSSAHFQNIYKRLAIKTEKVIFVMGTGTNAIGALYVSDDETMVRIR